MSISEERQRTDELKTSVRQSFIPVFIGIWAMFGAVVGAFGFVEIDFLPANYRFVGSILLCAVGGVVVGVAMCWFPPLSWVFRK